MYLISRYYLRQKPKRVKMLSIKNSYESMQDGLALIYLSETEFRF